MFINEEPKKYCKRLCEEYFEDFDWYDDDLSNIRCSNTLEKDLRKFLQNLVDNEEKYVGIVNKNIHEDFTSDQNAINHFNAHCIGGIGFKNKKYINYNNLFYNFTDQRQYTNYEEIIVKFINKSINSKNYNLVEQLFNIDDADEAITNLKKSIINKTGSIICFSGSTNILTKYSNCRIYFVYSDNLNPTNIDVSINVLISTLDGKTITLYPVRVESILPHLTRMIVRAKNELDFKNKK